jgi:hypothetical protein
MKLFTTFAAGLLLWGAATAFAQTRIGVNQSNGIRLGKTTVKHTTYLENNSSNPGQEIELMMEFPYSSDNASILATAQRLYNQCAFGKKYTNVSSPIEAAKAFIIDMGLEYRKENEGQEEWRDGYSFLLSVSHYTKIVVMLNHSGFLSFYSLRETLDGNHPIFYEACYVIDINAGAVLELSDLIRESDFEEFGKKVLGYRPTNNFVITDQGVCWVWRWGTIGGWLDREWDDDDHRSVFVSWATMLKYLSPYSPLLPLAKAKAGVS